MEAMMQDTFVDRIPPQELDAERAVLGSIILDRGVLDNLALAPDDFYADANRKLFDHLVNMPGDTPVDAVTLKSWLVSAGDFEAIGGAAYLAEVMQSVGAIGNVGHYARLVKAASDKRQLIQRLSDAIRAAYEGEAEVAAIARDVIQGVERLGVHDGTPKGREVCTLEEATQRHLAEGPDLVTLGLPLVDTAIGGGVARGEMVIIAGRPSHGKTAVALQCLHHATARGMPSLLISQEMGAAALGKRTIQYATSVPQKYWYTDKVMARDLAEHFASRAPCYLAESCQSLEEAVVTIRYHVSQKAVEVVAVDYAQLLTPADSDKRDGDVEKLNKVSKAMRGLAVECNVVLLVLCQFNRQITSRKLFAPQMSDIKGSGQFEQDADVILFPVWPHKIDPSNDPHDYQVWIGKNKNRETGPHVVDCKFNPTRQKLGLPDHDEFDGFGE